MELRDRSIENKYYENIKRQKFNKITIFSQNKKLSKLRGSEKTDY